MRKQVVTAVLVMSLALVSNSTQVVSAIDFEANRAYVEEYKEDIENGTFFVEGYKESIMYKTIVTVKVGETLTLDKLNIYNTQGAVFEPFEKVYDKIGKYEEVFIDSEGKEYPFTVYVECDGDLKIVGAKDITVMEGEPFNVLEGVVTTKKANIKVSKYDKTLVDVTQKVTITAEDSDHNKVKKRIKLYIKNKPVTDISKKVYMRCRVNMHIKPSYNTKNLGGIPYNTKVQVTGVVKVGKFKWYRVKYKDKTAFIFAEATSNKKLPKVVTSSVVPTVETKASIELSDQQDTEDLREGGIIDHNGEYVRCNYIDPKHS